MTALSMDYYQPAYYDADSAFESHYKPRKKTANSAYNSPFITQTVDFITQTINDIDRQQWSADIAKYIFGNHVKHKQLINLLRTSDNLDGLMDDIFSQVEKYQGANSSDPIIDLLSDAGDVVRKFADGIREDELTPDAWQIIAHAITFSGLPVEYKLSKLGQLLRSHNAETRFGAINALSALAHNNEAARPVALRRLREIVDTEVNSWVRQEASDHLSDLS